VDYSVDLGNSPVAEDDCELLDAVDLVERILEIEPSKAPVTLAENENSSAHRPKLADPITIHSHEHRHFNHQDRFMLNFALWMSKARLSRKRHTELIEALNAAGDISNISQLPKRPETLVKRLTNHVPLERTRTIDVKLDAVFCRQGKTQGVR
jgi:hypothetical protein